MFANIRNLGESPLETRQRQREQEARIHRASVAIVAGVYGATTGENLLRVGGAALGSALLPEGTNKGLLRGIIPKV